MNDIISPPATLTVTRTCSVASEMTGNDVLDRHFVEQEESSIMEPRNKKASAWTNAKHSLYLKSIEASFIGQLYNSLDVQSSRTQKNLHNASTYSGQFKVLRGGCWSKKRFSRENSQLQDSDTPHDSPGNPWIQHFTNQSRHGAAAVPSLHKRTSETLCQFPATDSRVQPQMDCSNTEVTGQNFMEDTSVENSTRKRTRTSTGAPLNNDQVVPFCTSPTTENCR